MARFKVGDLVRVKPEALKGFGLEGEYAVREIIYVDECDDKLPYQLDGDGDFRLYWWGDDMLERYDPNKEHRNLSQESSNCDKFTLTPEEVELVKVAIEMSVEISDAMVKGFCGDDYESAPNEFNNLLNRIKKYQDERRTNS